MEKFPRIYYAYNGKGFTEYNADDLEKRIRSAGIGDYYFHESVYEKDSSMRTRVEKGYILASSDDGRKYGISGKFLQNGEIARTVAASRGLNTNQINRLVKGKSISYLSGLSHTDATVLLSGMGLKIPSLEEFLGWIRTAGTGEFRRLNGEVLQSHEVNSIHNPFALPPDTWTAEYLGDRIVYAGGEWQVHSTQREKGGLRTFSVPLSGSGIVERYQEAVEAAGGRFTFLKPPTKVPKNPVNKSVGYLSDENLEPKVALFIARNDPGGGINATLDYRINPDSVIEPLSVGVRSVLDRSVDYN